MSRVVKGALLSQKKLYIACPMSETAQAGMGVDVAVYHRVKVSNPFMLRVFPLKLKSLDFHVEMVSLIFLMRFSMLILVESVFPK